MDSPRRLPLTVIGGFLGAGKTTLLNRWLRNAGGQRLAVLVNDFGDIAIDATLIDAAGTIALANGCVCCQIGDDLSRALIQVLDRADAFDAVVIEASGVSDPWRVAQLGRADPGLVLDGVIVLVDASALRAQHADPLLADTIERQIKAADLVVVNKIDLVAAAEGEALRDWIDALAGPVPQFPTVRAEVPPALLSGAAMPMAMARAGVGRIDRSVAMAGAGSHSQEPSHEDCHDHAHPSPEHGAVFDTWSCRPVRVFEVEALRDWLADPPGGLLRLKGFVRAARRGDAAEWFEIQFAGRHGALRPARVPADGPADGPGVVAIALRGRLPADALQRALGDRS